MTDLTRDVLAAVRRHEGRLSFGRLAHLVTGTRLQLQAAVEALADDGVITLSTGTVNLRTRLTLQQEYTVPVDPQTITTAADAFDAIRLVTVEALADHPTDPEKEAVLAALFDGGDPLPEPAAVLDAVWHVTARRTLLEAAVAVLALSGGDVAEVDALDRLLNQHREALGTDDTADDLPGSRQLLEDLEPLVARYRTLLNNEVMP